MKALTQDEIFKVLKAAADNPRDLAMILLAFRHGMRASEVCGLELKDIRGVWPRLISWPFVWSVLHRRIHPEFPFIFTRFLNVGYVGYFQKHTKTG